MPAPPHPLAQLLGELTLAMSRRDVEATARVNAALMQALQRLEPARLSREDLASIGRALRAGSETLARGQASTQRALSALFGPSATYSLGPAGAPAVARNRRYVSA